MDLIKMKAEQLDIDDQIYDEEQKQKQIIQKLRGDTLGIK